MVGKSAEEKVHESKNLVNVSTPLSNNVGASHLPKNVEEKQSSTPGGSKKRKTLFYR